MNKVVDMNNKKPKKGNSEQQEDTEWPGPLDRIHEVSCRTNFLAQAIPAVMSGDIHPSDIAEGCQLIMEDITNELIAIRDLLETKI